LLDSVSRKRERLPISSGRRILHRWTEASGVDGFSADGFGSFMKDLAKRGVGADQGPEKRRLQIFMMISFPTKKILSDVLISGSSPILTPVGRSAFFE
jgi:hypothetical protein